MTTRLSRGSSTSMFLRLCSRAPRTTIFCIRRSYIGTGRGDATRRAPSENTGEIQGRRRGRCAKIYAEDRPSGPSPAGGDGEGRPEKDTGEGVTSTPTLRRTNRELTRGRRRRNRFIQDDNPYW